jgi:hypothetical protein
MRSRRKRKTNSRSEKNTNDNSKLITSTHGATSFSSRDFTNMSMNSKESKPQEILHMTDDEHIRVDSATLYILPIIQQMLLKKMVFLRPNLVWMAPLQRPAIKLQRQKAKIAKPQRASFMGRQSWKVSTPATIIMLLLK